MTQTGGDFQAESVELNDSSTVGSEPHDSDTSSRNGNDASSSDDGAPTQAAARTAVRQIEAHMSGPGDGDEIREGRARAQTRALNREAAAGLTSTIGPCEGGCKFHALLAAQDTGSEPTRLADCLLKETEPEPTSYSAARSSMHSGVWTEAMQARFDILEGVETSLRFPKFPRLQYCRVKVALEVEGRPAWHD